jgi:hypothetical protein
MHVTLLLLSLLAAPDAGLPPAAALYVTGSSVNLRAAPSPTAERVAQLPIATECHVAEQTPEGWARVRCGALAGWTRAELLSATRPTLEPLLARARDRALSSKERLEAALRAVALAPGNAEADALLRETFFATEWKHLEASLAKGSRAQHFATSCGTGVKDAAECAARALGHADQATWQRIEVDREKSRFVSVVLTNWASAVLLVRLGTYSGEPSRLTLSVVSSLEYPVDPLAGPLERTATPWERQLAVVGGPSADEPKPKLSDAAAAALASVEGSWLFLNRGKKGAYVQKWCEGGDPGVAIRRIEDGTAELWTEDRVDGHRYQVLDARQRRDGSVTVELEHGREVTIVLGKGEGRVMSLRGDLSYSYMEPSRFVHEGSTQHYGLRKEPCVDEP